MSKDQPIETKWRYFGRDSGTGRIYEIYRCPPNGKRIAEQALTDVHLLLRDGSWRRNMRETLVDEIVTGWFSERDDEISEAQLEELRRRWQAEGWPGRK
jgi:hypothetical protein